MLSNVVGITKFVLIFIAVWHMIQVIALVQNVNKYFLFLVTLLNAIDLLFLFCVQLST